MTDLPPPSYPEGPELPADAPVAPPPAVPGLTYGTFHDPAQAVTPPGGNDGFGVSAPPRQRRGVVGAAVAAVLAFVKYGFLALKGLGSFLTLLVAIGSMTILFGWQFGIGIVALIGLHETGHMVMARRLGHETGWPIFLGPFGAVVGIKGLTKTKRDEALIAIAGPLVGITLAWLIYGVAILSHWNEAFLVGLAYIGFFLTLFNLIPLSPLDGGRVAGSVSKRANIAGIVILGVFILGEYLLNHFVSVVAIFILIVGTMGAFRRSSHLGTQTPLTQAQKVGVGMTYLALIVLSLVGMTTASALLAAHGIAIGS